MGLFHDAKIYGLKIRESADDGSDFSSPEADYRLAFIGEDGQWHLKDSSGTVTDLGGSGIPASLFDAKGDLIVASAADTAARLAAAANGATLITASGESTGLKWRLNNDGASAAPTVNDDSGDGYSVGSRWLDTTNDKEYVCLDASAGAAVWVETTAAVGGGAGPTVVCKTSDESVSNTTLQDDDDFSFAVGASEVWTVELHLFLVNAANTGDFKCDFTGPSGAVIAYGGMGAANGATSSNPSTYRQQARRDGNTLEAGVVQASIAAENYMIVRCTIINDTNAGTLQFRWAQASSDGSNPTIVKAGSVMIAHQVA